MMPTSLIPAASIIALSYLDAVSKDKRTRQQEVVKARNYYDGEQATFLTDRLKEFLNADGQDVTFRLNIYRVVIEAVTERLLVKHLECADPKLKAWAAQRWADDSLDIQADDVHEMAVRDGEAFMVVDWDDEAKRARFTPHPLYVPTDANGDGFGCEMKYPDDDPSQAPTYAVKRWLDLDEKGMPTRQRATFYYPDRIEKFAYQGGGWKPFQDEGDTAWPLPWAGYDNKALGLPVVHFKNRGLRPEALDATSMQDALNKSLIDLLASADQTAFRIFVALGWIPTTDGKEPKADGSNLLKIKPGITIGTTRSSAETDFTAIDPADLTQLRQLVHDMIMNTAIVTNTPVSRFQITGLVAAEGTLKQQEEPLLAKLRRRQNLFGDAWEACFSLARRIENKFGTERLDEAAGFSTVWQDAQTRTDAERFEEWKVKREVGHVPLRQLWSEMGYSQEKITEMLNDPEIKNLTMAGYP